MPKVSVVIISYNMAQLARRAIQSVIDQTFVDFEIIVIDDGSTDDTREVVKGFGGQIRYFYQENSGPSSARNRGILEARGEYIAFLDSDDYWMSDKLDIQVKILDQNPRVGLVYAKVPVVNEKGEKRGIWPVSESGNSFEEIIEKGAFFQPSAVMVRRECFVKAGLFDGRFYCLEDTDMWLRIARYFELYEIKDRFVSYYYREDGRKPRNGIKLYQSQVRLYEKILYSYDDIPRRTVNRKLSMFQYLLGISYRDDKRWRLAFKNISVALLRNPAVETTLFYGKESAMKRFFKIMRPYVVLAQCFAMRLFSKKSHDRGVE